MQKSLLQDKKECYFTGKTCGLHKHHIFYGPNRTASEKYGCFVWLAPYWHNGSDEGVHFNLALNLGLKRACQRAFEEKYSHEKFMEIFGRNYLED